MERTASIRALVEQWRPARSRDGYPAWVRRRVTRFLAEQLRCGRGVAAVAAETGLSRGTVLRWVAQHGEEEGGFEPVVVEPEVEGCPDDGQELVVAEEPTTGGRAGSSGFPSGSSTGLSLVTPSGYRLEGLDLASALVVLERVGRC